MTVADSVNDIPSYGMRASSSRIFRHFIEPMQKYMTDKLKFCVARIKQMLMGGAHAVSLTTVVKNESCLQVLKAVLSGAMAFNDITIKWHIDYAALLLPDYALSSMFSVNRKIFQAFQYISSRIPTSTFR